MHKEQGNALYEAHQVWWAWAHLPFHVALVLLLEGSNQFVIWARMLEDVGKAFDTLMKSQSDLPDDYTSTDVSEAFGDAVFYWLQKYTPEDVIETYESVNETLEHIAEIPNSFWTDSEVTEDSEIYQHFLGDVAELYSAMVNAVFNAFDIVAPEPEEGEASNASYNEMQDTRAITDRFVLIVSSRVLPSLWDVANSTPSLSTLLPVLVLSSWP
jgi:hypothetical protein